MLDSPGRTNIPLSQDALPASGVTSSRRVAAALAIGAVTLLAFALRLHGLGQHAIWIDEAATIGFARLPLGVLFGEAWRIEATPPPFYALAHLWLGLVGEGSATLLRLPGALAGVAAVPLLACFAWRGLGGARAGLAAALLLAVAVPHLLHSQDARVYPLFFLVYLAGLLAAQALARALGEGGAAARPTLALGVLGGMLVWLHLTGVVAAATLLAYAVAAGGPAARHRQARRRAAASLAGAALLMGAIALPPLLVVADPGATPRIAALWIPVPDLERTLRVLERALLGPQLGARRTPGLVLLLGAIGAALWAGHRRAHLRGCLAALASGALALHLASQVAPMLLERTALFLLAPLLALAAAGVAALPPRPAVVLLAGLVLVQAWGLPAYYRASPHGEEWRAAAARLEAEAPAAALVVTRGGFEALALRLALGHDRRIAAVPHPRLGAYAPLLERMEPRIAQWPDAGPARLCAAGGLAPGVWLVGRNEPPRPWHGLAELGAVLEAEWREGRVRLQRWSAPRCPPGA